MTTFDLFKTSFNFRQNGQDALATPCGVILSLLILMVIIFYGEQKWSTLVSYGDTNHQTIEEINAREPSEIINYEEAQFPLGAFYLQFDQIEVEETGEYYDYEDIANIITLTAFQVTETVLEFTDETVIDGQSWASLKDTAMQEDFFYSDYYVRN